MEKEFTVSERVYAWLVQLYPPAYRGRFGHEMMQVFHRLYQDTYADQGAGGVLRMWLPVLWDWAWTAVYQWLENGRRLRRYPMNDVINRQIGDMTWSIACGLRAGYSIRQVFEALAVEAPEPSGSVARKFLDDLEKGGIQTALHGWRQAQPALGRLADVIEHQRQTGENLAELLDPVEEELVREYGSDPAFYTAMRRQAEALSARLPERARLA